MIESGDIYNKLEVKSPSTKILNHLSYLPNEK